MPQFTLASSAVLHGGDKGGEWQKAGGSRNPTERVYREGRAASPWPQCYSKSLRVVARPLNYPTTTQQLPDGLVEAEYTLH